jgi:iron complex transport system substrate-binding protein
MPDFLKEPVKYLWLFLVFLVTCCTPTGRHELKYLSLTGSDNNSYAKRFNIIHGTPYSQLIITNPWQGAGGVVQKLALVRKEDRNQVNTDPALTITIPVKKVICMSTTHLAMISALHEEVTVKGFSGNDFIYDPEFCSMAEAGLISDVGYEDNLNKELILNINPDLIIAYGVGSESAGYVSRLRELGIKVLFDADYLEEDPLGKSEWIKVFGALFSKEKMADSIFRSLEGRYRNIKTIVGRETKKSPKVLLGMPFRDTWYISPGNSYISRLVSDAGGDYLWNGTRSSFSMPESIESVYFKALGADYWLNPGTVSSAAEIPAIDSRLSSLPAFRENHIYNNNKRINSKGGNDYWESGCLNPDIILMDMASIFHPELFPRHELFYYQRIN